MDAEQATDRGNDLGLVEAALFLAAKPMSRRSLAAILGDVAQAYVDDLLTDLAASYGDSARGIELHVTDGRAALRVKAPYIDRVAHLAPQQDIPRPVLRTLAVIAYNHPVTQADVVRVRGNKAYAHIHELFERRLIRAEEHGRTLLLHVTPEFLRHFGLSSAGEFRLHVGPPSSEDVELLHEADPPSGTDADQPSDDEGRFSDGVGEPPPDDASLSAKDETQPLDDNADPGAKKDKGPSENEQGG